MVYLEISLMQGSEKKSDDKLSKATTDSCKITTETLNGMLAQIIKDRLFNTVSHFVGQLVSWLVTN